MPVVQEAEADAATMTLREELPPEHLADILEGLEELKSGRTVPLSQVNIAWASEKK